MLMVWITQMTRWPIIWWLGRLGLLNQHWERVGRTSRTLGFFYPDTMLLMLPAFHYLNTHFWYVSLLTCIISLNAWAVRMDTLLQYLRLNWNPTFLMTHGQRVKDLWQNLTYSKKIKSGAILSDTLMSMPSSSGNWKDCGVHDHMICEIVSDYFFRTSTLWLLINCFMKQWDVTAVRSFLSYMFLNLAQF